MSDASPKETLARLKEASDALDEAREASHTTAHEASRARRSDRHANLVMNGIYKPKPKTKRRT